MKKQGDQLYERVKEYEEQWFGTQVMPAIRKLITQNLINITLGGISGTTPNERRLTGEEFLKGLTASWEDHNTCMNMTADVLMYMDRVYCADNRKATLFTAAMGLYREHILRAQLSHAQLITFDILNSVILDQIGMERDGDVINKHLIRAVVYMLESSYETDEENEYDRLYLTTFEPVFLQRSREFYGKECQNLLREGDASSWLRQTKRRLTEESDRCNTTISRLTEEKIFKVVEEELIKSHLQEFLNMDGSGVKAMIENDRYDDLAILYELVSRVDPTKEPLKDALQNRVVELGSEINRIILATDFGAAPADDGDEGESADKTKTKMTAAAKTTAAALKWVEEVLTLKDKFDKLWSQCLNKDLLLQTALTKSFADFINQFNRASEYVSLFIDDNLKRGIKGKTEQEVDEVLDKATTLIRYIQDKDMFETYYKKHLARRLLSGKSESTDVEKQMISRMKQEIGTSFTSKIEGMFKDMSLSEELTTGYRNHIRDLGDLGRKQIDLSVTILTTNCWPLEVMGGNPEAETGSRPPCTWPPQIKTLQESFKKFYLKERNGRRLTWLDFAGTADVRCVFPACPGQGDRLKNDRRYELNLSTHGMIILLLFNSTGLDEKLSFEEIKERTHILEPDLKKILYTLSVLPKARVLNKHPPNKDTPKPGDAFSFNKTFWSKTIKIKAPVLSGAANKVEGDDERKKTEERNDEHRGNVIDSVIVRVMKYVSTPYLFRQLVLTNK